MSGARCPKSVSTTQPGQCLQTCIELHVDMLTVAHGILLACDTFMSTETLQLPNDIIGQYVRTCGKHACTDLDDACT